MEYKDFSKVLIDTAKEIGIDISEEKAKKFFDYMNLLIEWNQKMNLTAITEPNEVVLKHFIDSITIEKYVKEGSKVIDIGTGAGFPGIPLNIIRNDLDITLMDSLNKRINFLTEVIKQNQLNKIDAVHARAEELSRNKKYREKYDVATSRAVASLNVLLEYMMPFVKVGGYCICMKGANVEEEINNAERALKLLNGKIEKVIRFSLPGSDYGRNIVIVKKIGDTSKVYPRKAGTPSKLPL